MKHPWLESRGFGVRDAWSVVVTTVALLIYGVLQERVMTRSWGTGNSKELFPHSAFLVLSNRLLTVAVLLAHSSICGHSIIPAAPIKAYCMVSASNMVSTLCQYEALKYVSFVTQTLAKTAKALPVLLWGTVIGRRRYRVEQYINAVLSTAGCSLFVLGGNIASAVATAHSNSNSSWWTYGAGMSLLLTYLAADGWTSTQQEHLFKSYGTTIREQLLYTTAFSTIYSLLATIAGRQLVPAVLFLMRHPSAAVAVLMLSAMSTVIQICISRVLQQHGALVFALMMTSRQCASVLLSSVIFQHVLTPLQW
jgi:adenosine 3'-phospho 5'-phosphosulfate transporter B2